MTAGKKLALDLDDLEADAIHILPAAGDPYLEALGTGHGMTEVGASFNCNCCPICLCNCSSCCPQCCG